MRRNFSAIDLLEAAKIRIRNLQLMLDSGGKDGDSSDETHIVDIEKDKELLFRSIFRILTIIGGNVGKSNGSKIEIRPYTEEALKSVVDEFGNSHLLPQLLYNGKLVASFKFLRASDVRSDSLLVDDFFLANRVFAVLSPADHRGILWIAGFDPSAYPESCKSLGQPSFESLLVQIPVLQMKQVSSSPFAVITDLLHIPRLSSRCTIAFTKHLTQDSIGPRAFLVHQQLSRLLRVCQVYFRDEISKGRLSETALQDLRFSESMRAVVSISFLSCRDLKKSYTFAPPNSTNSIPLLDEELLVHIDSEDARLRVYVNENLTVGATLEYLHNLIIQLLLRAVHLGLDFGEAKSKEKLIDVLKKHLKMFSRFTIFGAFFI